METLSQHLSELEELVSAIRLDVEALKGGDKHKSVEARKRLSVVGKLSSKLRAECLDVAKPPKTPKLSGEFAVEEVAVVEVLSAAPPVEVDNIVHTAPLVEAVVAETKTLFSPVLTPEEKSTLHTLCVDALQTKFAAVVEPKKSSAKKSLNPRARAARSTKQTKPCGAC